MHVPPQPAARAAGWVGPHAACVACLVVLLFAGAAAHAQSTFSCITRDGRKLSEAFPPQECSDREVREHNRDGSLRRVIPAPLTQAEKDRLAAEERRQRDIEETARQQRRRDRALLEAYGTEQEIETTRERALANRRALVTRTEQRLTELARDRKRLDSEAEFYAKRQLPDKLKRAFENNEQVTRQEQKILADTNIEMQRISERFDAEARRFRELLAAGAQPAARKAE